MPLGGILDMLFSFFKIIFDFRNYIPFQIKQEIVSCIIEDCHCNTYFGTKHGNVYLKRTYIRLSDNEKSKVKVRCEASVQHVPVCKPLAIYS